MHSCSVCGSMIEKWLGHERYCFACLNNQDIMNAEFEANLQPLVAETPDPIAIVPHYTPRYTLDEDCEELELDITGQRDGWNTHVHQRKE